MNERVRRLIQQAPIDSLLKLHVLLRFHECPSLNGSAREIAEQMYTDPWSAEAALRGLERAGLLRGWGNGPNKRYYYRPTSDLSRTVGELAAAFGDAVTRAEVIRHIKLTSAMQPYHPPMFPAILETERLAA